MVTARPDSAILPDFELAQRAQGGGHRVVPVLGRAGGELQPIVEAGTAEQLPRQVAHLFARVLARDAARQAQGIGAEIGDEDEGIGDRRPDVLAGDRQSGRQRSGQRFLHLGIVGRAARFAIDLEGDVEKPRRAAFQVRELLEPEADRAKPLIRGRRALDDLEPVLDLEIGEMRLDHAEQRAAVLVGGHGTAQANAGFDTRRRPDVTGRVLHGLVGDLHRRQRAADIGRKHEPGMRGFQLSSAGEARLHANSADQREHRDDAQQQSRAEFGHGTLTLLDAGRLGVVD